MCIAIYSLKGNEIPTKEILKNCFKANPDGAGFAYTYKGTVYTYKGFFKFDEFYKKLTECDKKYNLKNCGVLIHFRIATHGGINAANCHPFSLSSKESKLKATFVKSNYAVIHNGVCSITATVSKKETLSDTALFVRDYLSKIATFNNWFDNPYVMSLVESMIDSKMAILNADGRIIATSGFHRAEDGNYYSNYSYKERDYGIYRYGFFDDDWYSGYYPCTNEEQYEMPLMEELLFNLSILAIVFASTPCTTFFVMSAKDILRYLASSDLISINGKVKYSLISSVTASSDFDLFSSTNSKKSKNSSLWWYTNLT